MKKLALPLVLALIGCESKPAEPPQESTKRPAVEAAALAADSGRATDMAATPPDAEIETPAPVPGECGGLVGVQRIVLQPTEEGDPMKFRFGTEPDALVYETEWTGDLNDDGVEDRIAVRQSKGTKAVRIVLVGCEQEFGLVFAGLASSIAVAPETKTVNERAWKNLGVNAGRGVKTLKFDGQKYAAP